MNENKIFVGGLSWVTTKEKLSEYFNNYGEVVECTIMINPETGKSRGFGFVTFKNESSVRNVLRKFPHQLDGRNIDPKECNSKNVIKLKKDASYNKIFVGGLPHDIEENTLKEFFNKYGNVTEVVIMYDQEKKKTRGFGFITYELEETVNKLVNLRFLNINGKKIEIKKAESQRPMIRSNSSSMTNISFQSSHNGFIPSSPYGQPIPGSHKIHAAHHQNNIMPPPPLPMNNLDTSFQIAFQTNGYGSFPMHHNPHQRLDNIASTQMLTAHGYPSIQMTTQHPSPQLLVQPWPITNQLPLQLHPASMQPNQASSVSNVSHQSLQTNIQSLPAVPPQIVQATSPPATPVINNIPNQQNQVQPALNHSQNQPSTQQKNNGLVQITNQIQNPQPSTTPNWYQNPSSTTPNLVQTSSMNSTIPSNTGHGFGQSNAAFNQPITFGYSSYVPGTIVSPANIPITTNWQQPNSYIYSAYPVPFLPANPTNVINPSSPPPQSSSQQGTYN